MSSLAPARYRWTVLAVGTGAQASFSALSMGLPAIAPAIRAHYGIGLTETGVVLGAIGAGPLLTLLGWGLLADRIGERAVLALGLGGAAAALVGAAWAPDYLSLAGLLTVAAGSGASVAAASGRAIMGWFESSELGLALGIRQTAVPAGGAAASAALPWLDAAGGLRAAFLALAASCLVGGIAGVAGVREAPLRPGEDLLETAATPLRDARMWLLAMGSGLIVVAQLAVAGFAVLFLHQARGVSARSAAVVLALMQLLGGVARIAAGRWSDRSGRRVRPLRVLALALSVAMVVAAALVDAPLVVVVPALVAAGVLGFSWNGLSFTAAAERAGRGRTGAALGFQQSVLWLFVALVPVGFAALVSGTSWQLGFALAALGPFAGWLALRPLGER
jgi:sugar phosphate permease